MKLSLARRTFVKENARRDRRVRHEVVIDERSGLACIRDGKRRRGISLLIGLLVSHEFVVLPYLAAGVSIPSWPISFLVMARLDRAIFHHATDRHPALDAGSIGRLQALERWRFSMDAGSSPA